MMTLCGVNSARLALVPAGQVDFHARGAPQVGCIFAIWKRSISQNDEDVNRVWAPGAKAAFRRVQ
jgi:hypothetical protein